MKILFNIYILDYITFIGTYNPYTTQRENGYWRQIGWGVSTQQRCQCNKLLSTEEMRKNH